MRPEIVSELQRIADLNGGMLMPAAVVESARPINSPLHASFEWDETKAADSFRLWQARQLISVCVKILPNSQSGEPERVWVSLKQDRALEGGYRSLVSVLSDEQLRVNLLQDALDELEYFKAKYSHVVELSEVFRVAKKVQIRHRSRVGSKQRPRA